MACLAFTTGQGFVSHGWRCPVIGHALCGLLLPELCEEEAVSWGYLLSLSGTAREGGLAWLSERRPADASGGERLLPRAALVCVALFIPREMSLLSRS